MFMYVYITIVIPYFDLHRYVVKDRVNERVTEAEIELLQRFGIDKKDGFFDKTEFIILCAIRVNILTPPIIQYIVQRFDQLDESGTGRLCYATAFKKYHSLLSHVTASPRARHLLRSQSTMSPPTHRKDSPVPPTPPASSPQSPLVVTSEKNINIINPTTPPPVRRANSFQNKPKLRPKSDELSASLHTTLSHTNITITPTQNKMKSTSFFNDVIHSVGSNFSIYKRRHDFFDIPVPEKNEPKPETRLNRAWPNPYSVSIGDFFWLIKYWDSYYRLPFIVGVVWLAVGTVYYAIADDFGWYLGFYMAVSYVYVYKYSYIYNTYNTYIYFILNDCMCVSI